MDFLEKHPVPWRRAEEVYDEWLEYANARAKMDREVILDANGNYVVSTSDASGYQSWFEGDMDGFIEFVNKYFKGESNG